MVKNPPAMQETQVRSLSQEDSMEKGMDTHSSILAWRIPWTVVPWGCKESDTTEQLSTHTLGACGILLPQPGIEPTPFAVEVQILNCWTTREVP